MATTTFFISYVWQKRRKRLGFFPYIDVGFGNGIVTDLGGNKSFLEKVNDLQAKIMRRDNLDTVLLLNFQLVPEVELQPAKEIAKTAELPT
jgi:hypothetical protein